MRNKMSDIPSNFTSEEKNTFKCSCGTKEEIEHIYYCKYLKKEKTEVQYDEIFGEHLNKLKLISRRFEHNFLKEIRKKSERKQDWPTDPW